MSPPSPSSQTVISAHDLQPRFTNHGVHILSIVHLAHLACIHSKVIFAISCTFHAAPTCVDAALLCYQRLYHSPANSNALTFFTRLIRSLYLLLYPLDAIPLPFQILLPQADLVVASADSQHVPTQTPAHPP